MRIGRGRYRGSDIILVYQGDAAYDASASGGPTSIAAALAALDRLELASRCTPATRVDPADVTPTAPIDQDVRILCTGFNYAKHAAEAAADAPANPTFFMRFASSLVGPNEPIVLPRASDMLDWEGEIAFVIKRAGRAIPAASALEHVGGYTCFGDHSVRDFQLHGTQATAGKNFDRSGAIGPTIVTPDEAPTLADMELFTRVDDQQFQHGQLTDLVFGVPRLIEYISTFMTLRPGDVVATGTPAGIGGRQVPPRWLRAGETITVDVPGIGILSNPVIMENV